MATRTIDPVQQPGGIEIWDRDTKTLLPGFVFEPTDEEIILCFLSKKANKRPVPSAGEVIEYDFYDDHEGLRKMFEERGKQCLYFFTKLQKKVNNKSRIKRDTQYGTWRAQNDKPICFFDEKEDEQQIGSKRSFKFMPKKGFNAHGRWIVHEYRLDGLLKDDKNEWALCKVKWKRGKESTCSFSKSTESSEITLDRSEITPPSPDTSDDEGIVPVLSASQKPT